MKSRPPPARPLPRHWRAPALALVTIGAAAALGWAVAQWWAEPIPEPAPQTSPPLPTGSPGAVATPNPPAGVPSLSTEALLATQATDWVLARHAGNPAIVVVEFPNLAEQGAALNRVAALVEKAGGDRGRVLDDRSLHTLIHSRGDNEATFYFGHDYRAEAMARFYSQSMAQGMAMHVYEARLRGLLEQVGMLRREGDTWVAQGNQALITFTATQRDDPSTRADETVDGLRRESVLRHELSHGEFFTKADYRAHCMRFWREVLTEDERARWRRLLAGLAYDAANEDLVVNEMQALLMHTPDKRAFNAGAVGVSDETLEQWRRRFREGWPLQ